MKIGISYINGQNYGDHIIYYTTMYLIEKILKENNIEAELITIDICQTLACTAMKDAREKKGSYRGRLNNYIRNRMRVRTVKKLAKSKKKNCGKLLIKKWHATDRYLCFQKNEMKKLEDLDLFIFVGGGIIKYRKQHFHYIVEEVTKVCDEKNIPVIISAAGVEGYNENNAECRLLKEALNRNCVKFISTRDDYETLKNCFISNPSIESALVCDPAIWTPERYGVKAVEDPEKIIGLNVIRPNIFKDYLYSVQIPELKTMYHDLTLKLLQDGYHVEFFSNGLDDDERFIDEIFRSFSDLRKYMEEGSVSIFMPSQPKRLIKRIAKYERYMAVRLHASIVGTSLGVPNISLVWNAKQLMFGERTGTSENFITKENFQADYIYEHLLAAKPWVVNEDYKNSVYDTLNHQIIKYCKEER